MDGTWAMQLVFGSAHWDEAELVEYLLDGDLASQQLEIDTRHGQRLLSFVGSRSSQTEKRHRY
jgi:hypothetical protein